jgi:hypothetical protein
LPYSFLTLLGDRHRATVTALAATPALGVIRLGGTLMPINHDAADSPDLPPVRRETLSLTNAMEKSILPKFAGSSCHRPQLSITTMRGIHRFTPAHLTRVEKQPLR